MAGEVLKIMMSGRVYYGTIVIFAVLISIIFSFVAFLQPAIIILWVVAIVAMLVAYVYMHSHWIEFTDEGINASVGILNVRTIYVPYPSIDNIGVNATIFERIAGLAEISIDTKGRAETELEMKNLPKKDVEKAVKFVKDKIATLQKEMKGKGSD